MAQILLSTTGTPTTVTIDDLGARTFTHPVVDLDLLLEYSPEEIRDSADLQAALDASEITLKDEFNNNITDAGANTNRTTLEQVRSVDAQIQAEIDFKSDQTAPSHQEGRFFYDKDEHTMAMYNDQSAITHQLGQEGLIRVYNNSGSDISDGKPVYVSGVEGTENRATIALGKADSETTSKIVGVTTQTIINNSFGYVTRWGLVNGLNTVAFSDGDKIFLSDVNAGEFLTVLPMEGNQVVEIGFVIKSDASVGRILVAITDRGSLADNDLVGTIGTVWESGLQVYDNSHNGSNGTTLNESADYDSGTYFIQGVSKEILSNGNIDLSAHFATLTSSQKAVVAIYVDNDETVKSILGTAVSANKKAPKPAIPVNSVCLTYITIRESVVIDEADDVFEDCRGQVTGAVGTDEFVKVSDDDTDTGYLEDKIVAGTNVTLSTLNPGAIEQREINVPDGSTTTKGAVELATQTEVNAGTDTTRVVTPETLSNYTGLGSYTHPNHTGDVTSVGDGAQTIADDAVTYAKMQNVVADERILGNVAGAGGIVTELTKAQVLTMINVEDGATADQSDAEIKTAYENNANTNAFTDTDVTNLGNQSGTNTGDEVAATESVQGIAELATQTEVNTGTDDTRIVTPLKLANYTGLGGSVTLDEGEAVQISTEADTSTSYVTFVTALEFTTSNGGTADYRIQFSGGFMRTSGGGTPTFDIRFRNTTDSTTIKEVTGIPMINDKESLSLVAYASIATGKTIQVQYKVSGSSITWEGFRQLDYRGIE